MILNVAFYKFVALDELPERRSRLRDLCASHGLRGTILLSPEGINGFLAGREERVRELLRELRSIPELTDLEAKESWSETIPFKRLKIKLKKEIIPMGRPDIRPHDRTGARLPPAELKRWLDEKRDILVLDTRNDYEIAHGTFESAAHLGLKNFRQFGEKLEDLPEAARRKPVVMFCTGGIRCEKATALALREGFEQVFQLEGGILKYFEECGGAHFRGDCFVFDERGALGSDLGLD